MLKTIVNAASKVVKAASPTKQLFRAVEGAAKVVSKVAKKKKKEEENARSQTRKSRV